MIERAPFYKKFINLILSGFVTKSGKDYGDKDKIF